MEVEQISPDQLILVDRGGIRLNATILFTWLVMLLLLAISWLALRRRSPGTSRTRWQHFLEMIVSAVREQIASMGDSRAGLYLPFIGSLFLFIAFSNALMVIPGFISPTASLSTTAALAVCVFVAVPVFGIGSMGLRKYLGQYLEPSILMFPFHVIGELSRTLALSVRLFGNVMSGAKIAAILLAITPLLFPVVMQVFGLLTGLIQAYIFAILAMVYISSASQARNPDDPDRPQESRPAASVSQGP